MSVWDSEAVRREFPGLNEVVWLNSAGIGIAPARALDAVSRHLDVFRRGPDADGLDATWARIAEPIGPALEEAARLLSTEASSIALITDTTAGLHDAIGSIPFEPGDNVVLSDLEYPQVALAARIAAREDDVEVRFVCHRDGVIDARDYAAQVDARTKAILVSSVVWVTGTRLDLEVLGEIARSHGAFLVVDAIQEIGPGTIDLSRVPADFVVAGGYKWLNAPFGCGILAVSPAAFDRGLRVRRLGLLGMEPPDGGWAGFYGSPSMVPMPPERPGRTASRFGAQGTPNWIGAAGLGAALALRNELDSPAVRARVLALGTTLREELLRRDLHVWTPEDEEARAGITTFTLGRGPEADVELWRFLESRKVVVVCRWCSGVGGVRVATHYFNDENDLTALLTGLDEFLRRRS